MKPKRPVDSSVKKQPAIVHLKGYQSGIAGEYFVAAEPSRRGFVAPVTLRNTAGIDILASNNKASRTVGVQVKTSQGMSPVWTLGEKAEKFHSPTLFYVFVNLHQPGQHPHFFIVPSRIVARAVTKEHRDWLHTTGRGGREHRENPMRKFFDLERTCEGRWDLLGLN